ncbi:reverse transcriptase domain-containing protein [Tanacetum coccineum]
MEKARAVRCKSGRYAIINIVLYKKSYLGSWLRCVGPLQANYVLREIHEGSCSMHAGTRSVLAKAIRTGYYWPTMHADARKMIKECQDCQVHRPVSRNPQQKLIPIMSPWLFYKWGIDIAGPFPKGPGKFKFGLPGEIIYDNGKQFRDNPFKDCYEKLCIRQHFASVKHPQANGLVERANRTLGEGIKARLDKRSKDWIKEISHVLWAHRTMIKSSNGDTPFSLTYGTKTNDEALEINLGLLEEIKEKVAIREARSKAKMEKYYNSKVLNTSFKPRDLVYRNNDANHTKDSRKLSPKWEGPYEATKALVNGAYKLRDRSGKLLP